MDPEEEEFDHSQRKVLRLLKVIRELKAKNRNLEAKIEDHKKSRANIFS